MAETLAPMLQSGGAAAFERPVSPGGSYLEAAGNLLSFFGQATAPQQVQERQPSEDERFAADWQQAVEQAGIAVDQSNPRFRQNMASFGQSFIQTYPEYRTQAMGMLGAFGIETLATPAQEGLSAYEEALGDFSTTPQGVTAVASAINAATRPDGTFDDSVYAETMNRQFAAYVQFEADVEALNREAEMTNATETVLNTRSERLWNSYKPIAENLVDSAFIELRNVVTQMRTDPGGQAQIDEALAAQLGLPTTINSNNFVPFLQQYRFALQRGIRDGLLGDSSIDPSMVRPATDQWYNEVLAPIDALIASGSQGFDTATQVLDNVIAGQDLGTLRSIQQNEPELFRAINLGRVLPPEFRTMLQASIAGTGIAESTSRYILDTLSADIPVGDRQTRIERMSSTQRQEVGATTEAALATGQLEGLELQNSIIDMVTVARQEQGDVFFPLGVWNSIVVNNADAIAEQASVDPQFGAFIASTLSADLNMNYQQVRNELQNYPGTVLSVDESGNLFITVDDAEINRILDGRGLGAVDRAQAFDDMQNIASQATALRSVMDFNTKLGTLGRVGDIGSQVTEAFVVTNRLEEPGGGMSQSQSRPSSEEVDYVVPLEVSQDTEFVDKVFLVSNRLGVNPNDLFAIMNFETGGSFSPSQRNAAGSGATGLIQFMPSTAQGLGTSTEALANMTRAEQMDYVERYFKPFAGRLNNFGDLYMAVLWPRAVGESDDYVLFSREDGATYTQNAGLDINGDGRITRGEAVQKAAQAANYPYTSQASYTANAFNDSTTVMPDTTAAPMRPLTRPEREPLASTTRPQARPTTEAPTQSVRPQARPEERRETSSSKAVTSQRNRAIDVLTRGGFTKGELRALGIV